jgi:hypothetical protein
MNCVNHPDIAVAAYCQNCGKALCAQCVRAVSGVIYCEQCLAARLGIGGAGYTAPGTAYTPSGTTPGGVNYAVGGVIPTGGPNPGTATLLGFIPGVGAMYNGQFVKALVHVLVFVVLIGITDNHGIFGIFIAAWIAYQVFDANQTAKARRDGLPLPDPFGLNELGAKLGIPNSPVTPQATQTYTTVPPPPAGYTPPVAGFTPPAAGYAPPSPPADYAAPYAPFTAVPPVPPLGGVPPVGGGPVGGVPPGTDPYAPVRRREPIGAIILIGLGLLFLFNTLGFFRFDWFGHTWPFLIIALGAWLLIRRTRGVPPPPPPPPSGGLQ